MSAPPKGTLVLLIEAAGHLPVESHPLNRARTNLDFALQLGRGPGGVVHLPNGEPATTVAVAYVADGQQAGLHANGTFFTRPNGRETQTDAQGRFHFEFSPGTGDVFESGPAGFGQAKAEASQTVDEITLEPWAHVQGCLMKNGFLSGAGLGLFWQSEHGPVPMRLFLNLPGTTTDKFGRLAFDFVPPGNLATIAFKSVRTRRGINHIARPLREFTTTPGANVDLGNIVSSGRAILMKRA